MADFTLPSKLVGERVDVVFDFTASVEWGETLLSQECTVTVASGVDASPGDIVFPHSTIVGAVATQKFYVGLPGVIYCLRCTAVGSTGRTYVQEALMAVLPSSALVPPPYTHDYSTTIYPIEDIESAELSAVATGGWLLTYTLDEVSLSVVANGGDLVVVVHPYANALPESVDLSAIAQDGTLVVVVHSYNDALPESVDLSAVALDGTCVVILIQYLNWPIESVDLSATFSTGTLV